MRYKKETEQIVYRKLVRDKIPDIIKKDGKRPFVEKAGGVNYDRALGRKILEEAGELFSEWTKCDAAGILKESADMLEVLLTVLEGYGLSFKDLTAERKRRACQRGRFEKKLFLESIGHPIDPEFVFFETPAMFFSSSEGGSRLIDLISSELTRSRSAWIASAFYSPGITNLLVSNFEKFIQTGGDLNILLSTMGNAVAPEHLTHLQRFVPGAKLKVFHPPDLPYDENPPNFHVKIYLFLHRCGTGAMLIGSSNFSQAGFCGNIEWNYFSQGEINLPFGKASPFESALGEFKKYWLHQATPITDDFINGYRRRRGTRPIIESQTGWTLTASGKGDLFDEQTGWIIQAIKPNSAQKEALDNLTAMRSKGLDKAAVVAATGVGKTYLAAFDFKASGANRVLYIAHRETILSHAVDSFRGVLGDQHFGTLLGRGHLPANRARGVFAMIQTLSRKNHLKKFSPDAFDYIVMDEFHHSEAASYRQVLDYFKPAFFLGLTATPERMDGRDVLRYCDYNIAYEVRILEAVDRGWLVPFQYFAIYDETDYSQILWRGTRYDEAELDKALINDTRTAIVAENILKFLPAYGKIKALAFCSSQAHAKFTSRRLTRDHNIKAIDLTSVSSDVERKMQLTSSKMKKILYR